MVSNESYLGRNQSKSPRFDAFDSLNPSSLASWWLHTKTSGQTFSPSAKLMASLPCTFECTNHKAPHRKIFQGTKLYKVPNSSRLNIKPIPIYQPGKATQTQTAQAKAERYVCKLVCKLTGLGELLGDVTLGGQISEVGIELEDLGLLNDTPSGVSLPKKADGCSLARTSLPEPLFSRCRWCC